MPEHVRLSPDSLLIAMGNILVRKTKPLFFRCIPLFQRTITFRVAVDSRKSRLLPGFVCILRGIEKVQAVLADIEPAAEGSL